MADKVMVGGASTRIDADRCAFARAEWKGVVALNVKRLPNGAGLPLPVYATPGASGLDLHAAHDAVVDAGTIVSVGTGFAVEIPDGYEGQVRPRSGLAARLGLTVVNTPGTIDQDYRGEVRVLLTVVRSVDPPEPVTVRGYPESRVE